MKGSVTIMRSYDYCHFEVALSSDEDMNLDQINDLRKQAALLVDEAVRQYQIAKKAEEKRQGKAWETERFLNLVNHIKSIPQNEWTIEQAATIRAYEDKNFWKELDEESYIYDSDPERDYHFSMLRRFQDTHIEVG